MTRWEYKVELLEEKYDVDWLGRMHNRLDKLGDAGWELVQGPTTANSGYYIFKRRKDVFQ